MTLADNWGMTAAERAAPLPCDTLMPGGPASLVADRAVTIDAPEAVVFRWLCQLRVAPYSYDWVDNFGKRSPRTLTPGLDRLEAGQRFMRVFRLESFAPDDHITVRAGRVVVTYAVRPGTRLLARLRYRGPAATALSVGDLVMMRRQLLTLKELAERERARP